MNASGSSLSGQDEFRANPALREKCRNHPLPPLHYRCDSCDSGGEIGLWRRGGPFLSREVALGDLDETAALMEIKQGLKPGEQVAEKPLELLSEEEKSKREQGRLARPAAARPAPPKPARPQ